MNCQEDKVGTAAVSVERNAKISKVRIMAGKAICKIYSAYVGALYQVVDSNKKDRYLIMTYNHVLPTISNFDVRLTQFLFQEIPKMSSVTLDKEHVKCVWTSRILDASVIEIFPKLAARFKSYGANFLQVKEATPNVDVVTLQFPSGTFSIAEGHIKTVNGDKVDYQIGTECVSSGSPLLNLDGVALAMHNAGTGAASSQPAGFRRATATALSALIKAYLEERPDFEPDEAIANNSPFPIANKLLSLLPFIGKKFQDSPSGECMIN